MAASSKLTKDIAESIDGDARGNVAPPQPKIEIGVLGAKEAGDAKRACPRASQRPEEHRLAGAIAARDDERRHPALRSNMAMPGGQ